jgi:hypothetical protein
MMPLGDPDRRPLDRIFEPSPHSVRHSLPYASAPTARATSLSRHARRARKAGWVVGPGPRVSWPPAGGG